MTETKSTPTDPFQNKPQPMSNEAQAGQGAGAPSAQADNQAGHARHRHRQHHREQSSGRCSVSKHHRSHGQHDDPGHTDPNTPDHPHRGRGRGGRMFGYGELRTIVLRLISEQPAHGYELIREIEDRSGGSYSPSPGVIYPTLSWLVDMGYALVEPSDGGRKLYQITDDGRQFLKTSRSASEALMTRDDHMPHRFRRGPRSPEIREAMEILKQAIRHRITSGPLSPEAIRDIADTIKNAADQIEDKQ